MSSADLFDRACRRIEPAQKYGHWPVYQSAPSGVACGSCARTGCWHLRLAERSLHRPGDHDRAWLSLFGEALRSDTARRRLPLATIGAPAAIIMLTTLRHSAASGSALRCAKGRDNRCTCTATTAFAAPSGRSAGAAGLASCAAAADIAQKASRAGDWNCFHVTAPLPSYGLLCVASELLGEIGHGLRSTFDAFHCSSTSKLAVPSPQGWPRCRSVTFEIVGGGGEHVRHVANEITVPAAVKIDGVFQIGRRRNCVWPISPAQAPCISAGSCRRDRRSAKPRLLRRNSSGRRQS